MGNNIQRLNKNNVVITSLTENDESAYWHSKTPEERLQALETNRTYLFPESLRELTIEIRKERREKASKKPRITTVPLTRSIKRSLIEPSSRNTFDNPQEDLYSTIDKMLEQLTPREREVIILRYGLPDSNREYLEPLTLKEIKGKFGITIEGVRKIEVKAIGKLRLSPKARLFRQLLTED